MLCNSFHRVALSSLWSKAISICKIGPFPFKAASWEQRPAPPPHFGLWSVYKLSLPHLFICSGRRGGHRWKPQQNHMQSDSYHAKPTSFLLHSKYVRLSIKGWTVCPREAWGLWVSWIEVRSLDPPRPPTPQEFVIPKRSWVSREVGVEAVWWIKLLSSLTHFAFPLNTVAWWITIGQEEVGGVGEKRRGRKCSKRDWCLVPAWNDL